MQIVIVDTKVGVAISEAPMSTASLRLCPSILPVDILNGDRCIINQNADRQGQTTKPHRVHGFPESTECDD